MMGQFVVEESGRAAATGYAGPVKVLSYNVLAGRSGKRRYKSTRRLTKGKPS